MTIQWRVGIAVALLIALFASGLFLGWRLGKGAAYEAETKAATDKINQVLDSQAQAREAQEKLQETLDKLPRSEGRIREVVRDNPSPCVRPPDVADGVRQAIRQANAARAVPSDS